MRASGRQLLTATDPARAEEAFAAVSQKWGAITDLLRTVTLPSGENPEIPRPPVSRKWTIHPEMRLVEDGYFDDRPQRPRAELRVELVLGAAEPKAQVMVDDLVLCTATVTMPGIHAPMALLHWDFGDGTQSREFGMIAGEEKLFEVAIAHRFANDGDYKVSLHDSEGELASAPVTVVKGEPRLVQLQSRFRLTDRDMTLASGLLASFSGLIALYTTSPTWGTPGDYLKAFLWGSLVSEGSKAVAALVSRTGSAA